MKLQGWVEKVSAMTQADLLRLRLGYDSYEHSLVTVIQTTLRPISKSSKLLSSCRGVSSCAQTALDAMKEVGEGVTVADFDLAHPNSGLAGPIAHHLQRWKKLGGLPDFPTGPTTSIVLCDASQPWLVAKRVHSDAA